MRNQDPDKVPKNPLCVFCLSPPFSIRAFTRPPERSASRRLSVRCWRRGGSSLLSVRPRFKPLNRRSCISLTKYLSGFFPTHNRKTLTLEEVLEEIQKAWKPQHSGKSCCTKNMDERWSKASSTSNEMLSPVLLRRRLSAPETIMRKHMLAQQRSDSQDSEIAHSETKINTYRNEMEGGSDSNLNRKRDPDLMRKTTLLRRLWSHSKPLTSTRFSEWQHSNGKLCSGRSTHSLTSIHSSPEHLVRSQSKRSLNGEFRTSPQHKQINRRLSPKHQFYEFRNRNGNFDSDSTTAKTSTTTTTPKTTTELETSTRYTNTSFTTFSDNSDSAYTNSRSNFSETSNNNSSTPSEIQKEIIEDTEVSNQDYNNSNMQLKNDNNYVKCSSANETATQTVGTTNVNVISNVQLSQSTLDLIFNQVMQDVQKSSDVNKSIVQVKQIPSFYLKRKDSEESSEPSRVVKCMISNVGIGSPYIKPPETSQIAVPRYSARPHTSSMEVNISSGESTDKESDTVSLVDSLEDTSSLRTDPMQNEIVANKSDISLELPDNSDTRKPSKPTAFFIPIETDTRSEIKSVSDHLPAKVRDRLVKRQQKREERNKSKQSSSRSDSNYISASENGNHIHCIVDNGADVNLNSIPLPEVNYGKTKKRINKPLLPSIESFRGIKIDKTRYEERKETRSVKRKSVKESFPERVKQKHWIPKAKNKKEKLTPLYTSKNEYIYDYGPRRIYHKTEFNDTNKRIEILEIMECVDNSEKLTQQFSKKSKIPVLINQKLPKISQKHKPEKPAFLDLDCVPISDPKLDQLIANILIETLNIPDIQTSVSSNKSPEKRPTETSARPSPKYSQKFDAIPEELSFQSSTENDVSNNNEDKNKNTEEKSSYQGKAAVAVVKDDNFSSIPKGWITFYMLHNNRGSPDSTSDEGKKLDNAMKADEVEVGNNNSNVSYDVVKKDKCYESNENCSSSSEVRTKTLPPTNGRFKKYNHQRKMRYKGNSETEKVKQLGEWSVTVSGTNSYGQFAPDLEMSVKFPDSQKNYNCPSQSDSGLGEDNEKSHFPKISTNQDQYKKIQDENEEYMNQRLPEIAKSTLAKKQRRSDSSVPSLGNMSSRIEPRQTRTSTRRYNLSRPKIDYQKNETPRDTISIFNDSHYAEILKRFPEILSITGNAINQGKK